MFFVMINLSRASHVVVGCPLPWLQSHVLRFDLPDRAKLIEFAIRNPALRFNSNREKFNDISYQPCIGEGSVSVTT